MENKIIHCQCLTEEKKLCFENCTKKPKLSLVLEGCDKPENSQMMEYLEYLERKTIYLETKIVTIETNLNSQYKSISNNMLTQKRYCQCEEHNKDKMQCQRHCGL
ncbi:MAG: hypothetical protein IPL26_19760 [Leptospiraceae bacterium]|nr:hypothetical protein [Leptospiraceae bacterium]